MLSPSRSRHGFTLVELAIVIVIIGLLVGSILSGNALLRIQRVRSMLEDGRNYSVAMETFNQKYGQLPGDFDGAETVWGNAEGASYTVNCVNPGSSVSPDGIKTCNGNGNGAIESPNEHFRAWQQMAAAGLITGQYSGVSGPSNVNDVRPGVNAPKGVLDNSSWFIYSWGSVQTSNTTFYAGNYNNVMVLGATPGGDWTHFALLTPTEAAGMDQKVDDGAPGNGNIRTFVSTWENANVGTCINSDDPAVAAYVTTSSAVGCVLIFMETFGGQKIQ